jgi:hypothetical protein
MSQFHNTLPNSDVTEGRYQMEWKMEFVEKYLFDIFDISL